MKSHINKLKYIIIYSPSPKNPRFTQQGQEYSSHKQLSSFQYSDSQSIAKHIRTLSRTILLSDRTHLISRVLLTGINVSARLVARLGENRLDSPDTFRGP